MKNEKNISDGKTAKRFRTISLIWLGLFVIRWFTPTVEVDLCGHATLAAPFVLFNIHHYPHAVHRGRVSSDTRAERHTCNS